MSLDHGGPPGWVGVRIRDLRRGAGLTQQQLADRAGVSTAAIRDLEQGRVAHPHPGPARRIAQALGTDATQWEVFAGRYGDEGVDSHGKRRTRRVSGIGREHAASPAGICTGLWIGVLGPLVVVRDGVELRARPAGQRAVLGLMALGHGSPVRLDSIVDALWEEGPPVTAAAIVQTYISRLRHVLGASREADRERLLIRDGSGYRLNVAKDELDLLAFRRLVEDARQAHAAGDPGKACRAYEQAMGQWRGEPLAGVAMLRTHPAVTALAFDRVAATLEYADVASGNGWHDRVLPHLRAATARGPLDEASYTRLMIALAGSGRQGEALGVYEELRRRLDEQLGVLPGPVLREAHARILRQEVPSQAATPGSADAWLPVFQLPATPADFTGRAHESARLISTITRGHDQPGVPLVVVSGPPGAGKTSLALQAAHIARAQFPDGQLWVQLAGTSARPREAGEVLGEFLHALGVHGFAVPPDLPERAACYRSRLAGRRILVVADDAATAAQIWPLVPGTAGCALVVTSRARLEGVDGAHLMPLDVMTADDATDLLARIVGEDRVAAEHEAAESLVAACGALPLALRIAGAKLAAHPSWPLSVMVGRITGTNNRLRELESGDLSVRASIASSYQSLPEPSRRAFRLLALLGPADFAEWVIGVLLGKADAADVIGELADRSLLTSLGVDATGEPRYRLHDLLRDFAAERLHAEPGATKSAALLRALEGWLQLAVLANAHLPPEPSLPPSVPRPPPSVVPSEVAERVTADPIAWFTAERVNLLAAVEQACQAGRLDLALQLAIHQCAFQVPQYRHDDAERL